ncbi:hypothetical protein Hypma_013171 [Hypsizygus marmoreus]|uniref:Uncharacterized protein n=1 Tax=Hypsizygus marmoreus TaxID=39966 RepID=A0A369JCY4_HYPMA|nr:hypothetical protein Hypma_013171 [Hypsizygus marmoreus]
MKTACKAEDVSELFYGSWNTDPENQEQFRFPRNEPTDGPEQLRGTYPLTLNFTDDTFAAFSVEFQQVSVTSDDY